VSHGASLPGRAGVTAVTLPCRPRTISRTSPRRLHVWRRALPHGGHMTDATSTGAAEHDVIVVGGRCAGAATAMLLAAQGLDVLVLDRAALPSDCLSTHAIARGGVV